MAAIQKPDTPGSSKPSSSATEFDNRGPGRGIWLAGGSLILGPLFILAALILVIISRRRAQTADELWALGYSEEANAKAHEANVFRIAAMIVGLIPLIIVFVAVLVVATFGEPGHSGFNVINSAVSG